MKTEQFRLKDGRALGFADCGEHDSVPVLLFHGTPGSRLFCSVSGPRIVQHGIRVVAPERPGYGLSDPKPNRTIPDWADDVRELADHLRIKRFHVAGFSGGGAYSLACAAAMPERVLTCTLISTSVPPEFTSFNRAMSFNNKLHFFSARYSPLLLTILMRTNARLARKNPEKYLRILSSQLCDWDKQVMDAETSILNLQAAYRQGAEGAQRDMFLISQSWHVDMARLIAPVFLWHGDLDRLTPAASARAFAETIPGCRSCLLPGAGHYLLESDEYREQIVQACLQCGRQTT